MTDEQKAQRARSNWRSWRDRQKAKGLCHHCNNPPRPGLTTCADCYQKHLEWRVRDGWQSQRRWEQSQKDKGLCTKCTQPALGGFTLCEVHRDRNREATKRSYRRRRERERGG